MRESEDFEDIIKSKFAEKDFSFDEENWENAEEMISSFRKKEKIKRGAIIFFSGLAIGVLVMLPFINFDKTTPITSINMIPSNNSMHPAQLSNKGELALNKKQDNVNAEQNHSVSNHKYEVHSNLKNKELLSGKPKEINDDVKPQYNKEKGISSSNIAAENNLTSSPVTQHKRQIQPNVKNKTVFDKNSEGIVSNEPIVPLKADEIKDSVEKTSDSVTSVANESSNKSSVTNKVDSMLIAPKDSLLAAVDSATAKDTNKVAETSPKEENKNVGKGNSRVGVSALAGINYSKTFSMNTIEGLEFIVQIIPQLSVGAGVLYTYLTVKSGAEKTIVTNTTYDFGYKSDVTDIKTDKIHYVVIPAFVRYNINEKNAILLGVNNYFLATVSNTYSTYNESFGDKTNVSSKKTYGYSSGFSSYDIGLVAGYRRTLFNSIGVGLYFNYGLKDIKKNEYYNEVVFNRNISGQFVLTYKLH